MRPVKKGNLCLLIRVSWVRVPDGSPIKSRVSGLEESYGRLIYCCLLAGGIKEARYGAWLRLLSE
jgi:hypothetical protein